MPDVTRCARLALALAARLRPRLAAVSRPRRGKPVVALVMKSLANEFFKTMEDGARKHQAAQADRYELVATGIKDEQDVARQIELVEQMIARGVQALVLAPADSRALVAVAQRALGAGIVVVNIDNRFDAAVLAERGIAIPFVGPDNRKGARMVGDAVAPASRAWRSDCDSRRRAERVQRRPAQAGVRGRGRCGWPADRAVADRALGGAAANQVVSALVSEHPDVKAVLCANDSMALGAVAALKAAGRAGNVLVGGFDNISAVQQLVRDRQILATADQHGDQLAVYGIEYALQMLRDRTRGLRTARRPSDLITAETLR